MSLLKTKDPVLLELKNICETKLAIPVTFIHANLFEANFGLDQLQGVQFPILLHVATTKNTIEINEANDSMRTAKVAVMLLNKEDAETLDFKSFDLNDKINEMRNLAENLIYWINKSSISVNGGVDKYEADNVYSLFDTHLFGQALSFDWKLDSATSGYYNSSLP